MVGRVRISLVRIVTILFVCGICLGTTWAARAHATAALHDPHANWVGEAADNFWGHSFVTCKDGFLIHAQQVDHDFFDDVATPDNETNPADEYLSKDPVTGLRDTHAYYLVLTSVTDGANNPLMVTPALTTQPGDVPGTTTNLNGGTLPVHAAIAGASAPLLGGRAVDNTVLFRFSQSLVPNASVKVEIQRWDHSLTAADDNAADPATDKSGTDDIVTEPDTVGDCSALPTTTAETSPASTASGWNAGTVHVRLAATDLALFCATSDTTFTGPDPACPTPANPAAGVHHITYNAAGAQTNASTDVFGGLAALDVANEGITTVTYFATDTLGNAETAHTLTVKIDKTPPVITIHQPAAGTYSHSDVLTLNYSLDDGAGSGVNPASIVAKMDGATTLAGHGLASGQGIPLLTQLSLGPHTFTVSGADNVGNSATKPVTFTVIATPQSILADVPLLVSSGSISSTVESALLHSLTAAATAARNGQCVTSKNIYNATIRLIQGDTHATGPITPLAASILTGDIHYQMAHC